MKLHSLDQDSICLEKGAPWSSNTSYNLFTNPRGSIHTKGEYLFVSFLFTCHFVKIHQKKQYRLVDTLSLFSFFFSKMLYNFPIPAHSTSLKPSLGPLLTRDIIMYYNFGNYYLDHCVKQNIEFLSEYKEKEFYDSLAMPSMITRWGGGNRWIKYLFSWAFPGIYRHCFYVWYQY